MMIFVGDACTSCFSPTVAGGLEARLVGSAPMLVHVILPCFLAIAGLPRRGIRAAPITPIWPCRPPVKPA